MLFLSKVPVIFLLFAKQCWSQKEVSLYNVGFSTVYYTVHTWCFARCKYVSNVLVSGSKNPLDTVVFFCYSQTHTQ